MTNLVDKIKGFWTIDRLLMLIILLALVVRSYEITESFVGHHDLMGAEGGFAMRNFLKYGLIETKLGAVYNVIDGKFVYYANHPQLGVLLSYPFFAIFGVSEWSQRLLGILFGVANVAILFLIVQKLWDKETALIASLFLAIIPEMAYFDRVPFGFSKIILLHVHNTLRIHKLG